MRRLFDISAPVIFMALLALLSACGTPLSESDSAQTQPSAIDARSIINGSASNDLSVVLYGCTSTVIGPRTVVTAAHCFGLPRAKSGVRTLQINGKKIKATFIPHPSFYNGPSFDVAIGFTDEDMEVAPKPLGKQAAWGWSTIRGYGCSVANTNIGYGKQRTGSVYINNYGYDGRYSLSGIGGAVACPGDSGGPLFQKGAIVGIMARTDLRRTTYFARLDVAPVRDWLLKTAAKMKKPICGAQPRGCQKKLFEQEIAATKKELAGQRAALKTAKVNLSASDKKTATWNQKLKDATKVVSTLDAEIKSLSEELKKIRAAKGNAAATDKSIATKTAARTKKNTEIADLKSKASAENKIAATIKKSIASLESKIAQNEKRLKSLDA